MLKKVLAVAVVSAALGVVAGPAFADPAACYDVSVSVQVNDQGQSLAQAGCLP